MRKGLSDDRFSEWKEMAKEKLRPYDLLFSALASLNLSPSRVRRADRARDGGGIQDGVFRQTV